VYGYSEIAGSPQNNAYEHLFNMNQMKNYVKKIKNKINISFDRYMYTNKQHMSTRDGLYEINIACTNYMHRWAHLLSQQMSITIYFLPTKENKLPVSFAANKQKLLFFIHTATSICLLQTANFIYGYIYIYAAVFRKNKRTTEDQAIFLNLFSVCSSCKRKLFVCPFVDEETNGTYPFANGLNGLAHL
jgi:hypothetical protein